jgi:hypothetical protein
VTTTSHPSPRAPGLARLSPAPVGWATVVALAAVMTLADCFVLTSVQGAVGAIERAQHPFAFWFRTSAVLLPVFVLAVLVALAVARRIAGPVLRTPVRVMVAALLIVLAGSVVGSGAMVVSAAYDYQLQSAQGLTRMDMAVPVDPTACTGVCAAQQSQFDVDQRAARLGSVLVLGANLVAVGWLVALRGGRLERTGPGGRRRPAAERRVRTA